jgi:hypothetical protein
MHYPIIKIINLWDSLVGGTERCKPLPTHRTTQIQNKHVQTSLPRVGYELTISVFEWAKIVHALDSSGTVVGE